MHEPASSRRALLDTVMRYVEQYLHVDDPAPFYFGLAVAVSAALEGQPLWGMLVGPPAGGKTEVLKLLGPVANAALDDVTAPGLLSWSDMSRGRPVGVLMRIPNPAFVTISDFSTVLASSQRGLRDQLFALLRVVFDGKVTRSLGNADKMLTWEGRVTLLAACTPAIDNYSSHSDALGPRWVFLRIRARDQAAQRAVLRKARGNTTAGRAKSQALARQLVRLAVARLSSIELSPEFHDAIDNLSLVTCSGRATVPRESSWRREIDGVVDKEEPPRVAKQLTILALCCCAIGLTEHEALSLCRRVALDSAPALRGRAVLMLAELGSFTAAEMARAVGCSPKTAARVLEDLAFIGIATQADSSASRWDAPSDSVAHAKPFTLTHEGQMLRSSLLDDHVLGRAVDAGQAMDEVLVEHPPPPNRGSSADTNASAVADTSSTARAGAMSDAADRMLGLLRAVTTAAWYEPPGQPGSSLMLRPTGTGIERWRPPPSRAQPGDGAARD